MEIGVYQGDSDIQQCEVDTIKMKPDLGYTFISHSVNLLQYVDDNCLSANGPAACQQLLKILK